MDTKLHTKSTDTRELLNPSSQHPAHTFQSIALAHVLRFKTISTSASDFQKVSSDLFKTLTIQGFSERTLNKAGQALAAKSRSHIPSVQHAPRHNCRICPLMFGLSNTQLSIMIPWTTVIVSRCIYHVYTNIERTPGEGRARENHHQDPIFESVIPCLLSWSNRICMYINLNANLSSCLDDDRLK